MTGVIDFKAWRDRKLGNELAALIAFVLCARRTRGSGGPTIVTAAPGNSARLQGVSRLWKPAATCSSFSTPSC
jgi:hypothetical protein